MFFRVYLFCFYISFNYSIIRKMCLIMKKNLSLWQFAGFTFTAFFGTLLHYIYEWSNYSALAAPFSGVNESTWEHMKLLFFPLFIFAIIQSFYFKEYKSFWCVKLIGITAGLLFIPIIYYTCNGAFGKSPDWFNISIFFIAAAITFVTEYKLLKYDVLKCKNSIIPFVLVCLIGALFVIFTFYTPRIPLFMDPISGKYGIG